MVLTYRIGLEDTRVIPRHAQIFVCMRQLLNYPRVMHHLSPPTVLTNKYYMHFKEQKNEQQCAWVAD